MAWACRPRCRPPGPAQSRRPGPRPCEPACSSSPGWTSAPNREVVLALPDEPPPPPLGGERFHRRGGEILLGDDELRAGIQRHQVAGVRSEVYDRANHAGGARFIVRDD